MRKKKNTYQGRYQRWVQDDVLRDLGVEEKELPSTEQLERELARVRYRRGFRRVMRSTLYTLLVVASAAVLTATLWLPVLQIYGSSMAPTLEEGNIVVSLKGGSFRQGQVVAFYYNNKILVKRVIATAGDWVDIDAEGNVSVNGAPLAEPYLAEKALGECDIELPYQVPEGRIFVMGDHRSVSVDSRSTTIGCVAEEQIVGRLYLCIWPLADMALFP